MFSGGTASFTTVSSGGFEPVSAGGSAAYTTLSASGNAIVYDSGVIISTTVVRRPGPD